MDYTVRLSTKKVLVTSCFEMIIVEFRTLTGMKQDKIKWTAAKMEDLVFIFDPCDPDDYASIEEQDRFYDEWKRTPRILKKPNDSAKADANLKDEHNTKPKKNCFQFWKHKLSEF